MKNLLNPLKYFLIVSCFMMSSMNYASADSCPLLSRDDIRTLCRWDLLAKLPGVSARKVTVGSVTILNNRNTCGQLTAIREFFNKHVSTTYSGQPYRDNKGIVCSYTIDKRHFVFGADGVDVTAKRPESVPIMPKVENQHLNTTKPPAKRVMRGFDMSGGGTGLVEIKPDHGSR